MIIPITLIWILLKYYKYFLTKNTFTAEINQWDAKRVNFIYTCVSWFLLDEYKSSIPSLNYTQGLSSKTYFINSNSFSIIYNKSKIDIYTKIVQVNSGTKCASLTLVGERDVVTHFIDTAIEKRRKYLNTYKDIYLYDGNRWLQGVPLKGKTFDNIFLHPEIKKMLIDTLDSYVKNKHLYEKIGVGCKRGYLFYGPSGCGKTSVINAIATHMNYDICKFKLSLFTSIDVFYSCMHETAPSVVVFEDTDVNKCKKFKFNLTYEEYEQKMNDNTIKYETHYSYFDTVDNCLSFYCSKIKMPSYNIYHKDYIRESYYNIERQATIIYNILHENDIPWAKAFFDDFIDEGFDDDNLITIDDLIEVFDNSDYLDDCIIIINTNNYHKINPSLMQRINYKIKFEPANKEVITDALKYVCKVKNEEFPSVVIPDIVISQSELLNTHIVPHIDNTSKILESVIGLSGVPLLLN